MGKFDKFLNMMRLNDDGYEEDLNDEYDDDDIDVYDDDGSYDDDLDEDYDDEPTAASEPSKNKSLFKKSETEASVRAAAKTTSTTYGNKSSYGTESSHTSRTGASRGGSNIISINKGMAPSPMEVAIMKPVNIETSSSVVDALLDGKAAVVNLETLDETTAQKIIDFLSGACYAIDGKLKNVSSRIFLLAPKNVDISGDISSTVSSVLSGSGSQSYAAGGSYYDTDRLFKLKTN